MNQNVPKILRASSNTQQIKALKILKMEIYCKPYNTINQLSKFDRAYATANINLRPFYKYPVNMKVFASIMDTKRAENINRTVLVEVLREQYSDVVTSDKVHENIEALLHENTFTVITAHQPSLFTGPLYFIYKTITTINLAEQLNIQYPESRIVPVFWIGGEDHDFEEINHLHLFGKTITWKNDERGATGMMQTKTLQPILEEVKAMLGNSENAQKIIEILERCFTKYETYGKATLAFTNELFQAFGLVVMSANHRKLKQLFVPIIKDELTKQSSKALVDAKISMKEAAGFKGQAHVREINLFYLMPNLRERIVLEDGVYKVLNTNYEFTPEAMMEEVDNYPERFSPNVVLRPVYQEMIFPNLAYIGGGGELSYWTERQSQFEYFKVNFPMLVRRNSVLWLDKGSVQKMEKLNLSIDNLFEKTENLIKDYVKANSDEELSLKNAKLAINQAFEEILEKATAIEATLHKTVLGEKTKQLNAIISLESRLLKAEKHNHEVAVNQIRGIKEKFFPNNGLQERHDNFLQFYIKYGDSFIQTLKDNLEPLNMDFVIISE